MVFYTQQQYTAAVASLVHSPLPEMDGAGCEWILAAYVEYIHLHERDLR